MRLTESEQLLYGTVRLKTIGPKISLYGTGFFYQARFSFGSCDVLITNKHVVENCDEISLSCWLSNSSGDGPSGEIQNVRMKLYQGGIVNHPREDVDLCAITCPLHDLFSAMGKGAFHVSLNSSLIPTKEEWSTFDAYEEILMVGCPNGLFDESNNLPILRRGITSSHPAKLYCDKHEFLIDAACFPGSSGSPVFLFDKFGYIDKNTGQFILGQKRVKLLGVLYSGPTISQSGEIILTSKRQFSISSMMNLGFVIRSSRLLELESEIKKRALAQMTQ